MRGRLVNRACGATALAAVLATGAPAAPPGAQTSLTCEFALSGWVLTQLELAEARSAERACRRARSSACTAEQGRVVSLEQRLRLLRNYVNGYCRR
jgi:hypothetical protein